MNQEKALWPESYYLENDPKSRWELLQKAAQEGKIDPQEKALREELWTKRYGRKMNKKGPIGDGYIGLWVTMSLHLRDLDSKLRRRTILKELDRELVELGLDATRLDARTRELVDLELLHAMRIFYITCNEGSYNSQLFGLMRLKENRLIEKIAFDVYGIAYQMPEKLGMTERFEALQKAAYRGFAERYPNSIDLLDDLINQRR